jgi:ArsR family transcriptional regulator
MEIRNYANILKVLGEPARLRLFKLLTCKELCVCEIEEVTGLKQATVSQQLKRLKEVDLVKERKVGKWSYYSLNKKVLEDFLSSFNHFLDIKLEDLTEFKSECEKLSGLSENIRIIECKCK